MENIYIATMSFKAFNIDPNVVKHKTTNKSYPIKRHINLQLTFTFFLNKN